MHLFREGAIKKKYKMDIWGPDGYAMSEATVGSPKGTIFPHV